MKNYKLVDQYGDPIERKMLSEEIAHATIGGVRSPYAGSPADRLDPYRLSQILKSAASGDPLEYFELAEIMEERDPHYAAVLGTRKRGVAQIEISVEAASDDKAHEAQADMIRQWLKRDELQDEIFNMMDAVGKGISFTEIIWDLSGGQCWPNRLEFRDPRSFTYDRETLNIPLLRDGTQNIALAPCKFIVNRIQAKSGLAIRGGLARVAAWGWMFKMFAAKDWAIFIQTYGQPIRIGKYGQGASAEDKNILFRAVTNIAGDCAAIMPDSMAIEFVEGKSSTGSNGHYEARCNWLDMQISKLVLGQTTTTDAVSGGHAVSKEHRKVQEDIERADAKALSATLNRDLIRPFIDLNFGTQKAYPRLVIARPEEQDVAMMVGAVEKLVPLGFKVSVQGLRKLTGLHEPVDEADVLQLPKPKTEEPPAKQSLAGNPFASFAPQVNEPPEKDDVDHLIDIAGPAMDAATALIIEQLFTETTNAASLEDLQSRLLDMLPNLPEAKLAAAMGEAFVLADLQGRVAALR